MTNLGNFLATVEHRRPDQILYSAGFVDDLHKRVVEHIGTKDIAGHYGFAGGQGIGLRPPPDLKPLDFSKYWEGQELPEGTTIGGDGVASVPSGFYHFWGYISPLRNATTLKEIEDYPMHDYSGWDDSHMAAEVRKAHAEGHRVSAWVGHMYESAWQIRGYEQFLIDTIERPAWAECILERIFQNNIIVARAAAIHGSALHSRREVRGDHIHVRVEGQALRPSVRATGRNRTRSSRLPGIRSSCTSVTPPNSRNFALIRSEASARSSRSLLSKRISIG